VKRFRLLKATSLLLLTMVVAGIILDEVRTRIRRHYGDRYQRDVADFREQAAAYRRPMLFGARLDDNAAAWYQQSFPHFSTQSVRQLGDVIEAASVSIQRRQLRQSRASVPKRIVPASAALCDAAGAIGAFHPTQRRSNIRFRRGFLASASPCWDIEKRSTAAVERHSAGTSRASHSHAMSDAAMTS